MNPVRMQEQGERSLRMEAIVTTDNLSKQYGATKVVQSLNLEIPENCIYGFLGPNGAGKSTTMKMLLGLVHPTEGEIRIFGKRLAQANRLEILKETGSLIESPAYYGQLTARENLEIIRELKKLSKSEIEEVLRIVHLEHVGEKRVSHFSLGMKQRLGIAAALMGRPRLLLLDEPMNGLDPAGIQEIRELICSLPEKYGMSVLLSSHLLPEMDQMAERIGIIQNGRLIFQDSLQEFHEKGSRSLILHTESDRTAFGLLRKMAEREEFAVLRKTSLDVSKREMVLPMLQEAQTAEMTRVLAENGIGILRLYEKEHSLEELFLHMTEQNGTE